MKRLRTVVLIVLGLILLLVPSMLYTMDETEVGIVTRFGEPLPGKIAPGLHCKLPWPVDTVVRMDRRLLLFDNEPTEMLTLDRKNVLVDSFVCWRIDVPLRFTQTVSTRAQAEARLLDLIASELGAAVGNEPIESFFNPDSSKVRLRQVAERARDAINRVAHSSFGIEVADLRINGFNLPPQNRASVIERMRTERARMATAYRAEGEQRSLEITAEAAAERERILADARAKGEAARGAGEAEALRIFAEAYAKDPELYRFMRTLESYEKIIDENTTVVIESDSQLSRAFGG